MRERINGHGGTRIIDLCIGVVAIGVVAGLLCLSIIGASIRNNQKRAKDEQIRHLQKENELLRAAIGLERK